MKLEPPINQNYAATVVRVKTLVKLQNADRLQGIPMFGLQAIVDLATQPGDLGILFPSECQLSEEFCRLNGLFRHSDLNEDKTHVGYIEDNRRVKAIKLRGNRSDALFLPLGSIDYATAPEVIVFREGDTFDTLNGHEICRKYVRPFKAQSGRAGLPKAEKRVDERLFPQHFESPHYARVDRTLDPNAWCVVTQKLHGTSLRASLTSVQRRFTILEKILLKVGLAYVDGS